eukprot:952283-Amphidinium_carterae.1
MAMTSDHNCATSDFARARRLFSIAIALLRCSLAFTCVLVQCSRNPRRPSVDTVEQSRRATSA